jgi:CO/xanthine dehydrogenase Mo-binding subunit
VYSANMRVEPSGQIVLQTPIIENGAGMLTVFRQIVAEEFGVPLDQISIEQSIEDIEVDRGVGGSRTTRMAGKLAIALVQRVQQRLGDLLSAELGLASEAVRPVRGGFAQTDGQHYALAEATSLLSEPLVEQMTFRATQRDRGVVFLAQAAEVEVDSETGAVKTRRVVSVHEVGRVVNPMLFETQIEGGALQGLGYAVMEALAVEDGRVTTSNLHEYRVPTIADLPDSFESVLLPPDLSLGLTPVGEGPNAGLAPAIANAVVDGRHSAPGLREDWPIGVDPRSHRAAVDEQALQLALGERVRQRAVELLAPLVLAVEAVAEPVQFDGSSNVAAWTGLLLNSHGWRAPFAGAATVGSPGRVPYEPPHA